MRTCLATTFLLATALVGIRPLAASDGTIGVYADLTATEKSAVFSLGVPRTLFIVAQVDGQTTNGISGAEFRIDGLPADWSVFLMPNPTATIALGDPFHSVNDTQRANLAWGSCTQAPEGRLLLYTAIVVANSVLESGDLIVLGGDPPSNETWTTPTLILCDFPDFTGVHVQGDTFHLRTRAPQDLDYSQLPGYDGERGVLPQKGLPGDVFHFRVVYSSADAVLPAAGSPRLELDVNGDGDALDPGEGVYTMSPADLDSTLANGKEYRFDIALGEPPGGEYRYRFMAVDQRGTAAPGTATAWRESLFVNAELADLRVFAEDVRVVPPTPRLEDLCTIVAKVQNRSERRVDGVTVRIENVEGTVIAERTLASMGPRSTTEVACSGQFSYPGFYPVQVIVDPNDDIPESDESNNACSHGIFVGIGTTGNLVINGLPPTVTVPPAAPFSVPGYATYPLGASPHNLVRGAAVVVSPSWQEPQSTRTDDAGEFSASFIAPAISGTYALVVRVDDGSRADSTVVQVVSAATPTPPHGPNLTVQMTASPSPGCPTTAAEIAWSVANHGDSNSSSTTVRLVDGTATVTEVAIGAVMPGGSMVLDAVTAPLASVGLHAFTAHVDPGSVQRELREDDNFAVASVRRRLDCFDLALESVQFDPTGYPCSEGIVHFSAQIANRGCLGSQAARVVCREDGTEIASEPLPPLAAGDAAMVAFAQTFGAGCHDLEFVLDPEGAAGTDCDSESNGLAASACILDCPPPPPPLPIDLRIAACDIHAVDPRPSPGDPVQFAAWVENLGPGDALAPVLVSFTIGGVVVGDSAVVVPPIQAGERVLVTAPGTWPAVFTPQVLTVFADPNGQSDAHPLDNQATRPLPWDLRPAAISACPSISTSMFSTCSPCQGIPITIRAVVLNDGLFDCDSVQVDFLDDLNGGGVIGSAVAHDVLAGNSCGTLPGPVSISYAFPTVGLQRVAVVVDPHDAILEQNETNNSRTGEVSVQCAAAPDLVAAVRLPVGSNPQPGDTVRAVEVEVRNRGTLAAHAVQARLTVDGALLCDLEMGDLQIGEARTAVCTTPWVAGAGCGQILEACADPNGRIGESNENNNCATSGTGAGETDLAVYPYTIDITPTHPNAGDSVFFKIGIYSHRGVESTCILTAEWRLNGLDTWRLIYATPLHLPGGYPVFPAAAAFGWVTPSPTVELRFELQEVCPVDIELSNNIALASLPWYVAPGTPVLVSDLEARSTPDGVVIRWSAEPLVAAFLLDRRLEGAIVWTRLPEVVPVASGSGVSQYEVVDGEAAPGARLEYRLLGRSDTGAEEVLGSVEVVHEAAVRLVLQLQPVRPNPFRPGGAFEFSLPEPRPVRLSVYDAAGRCVATLRSGPMAAGRHTITWDGRDASGQRVPAGVYFCRLVSGSFHQARRLVVLH